MAKEDRSPVPFMVRLMPKQLELLDELIERQVYLNRTEAVRDAVRCLIERHHLRN